MPQVFVVGIALAINAHARLDHGLGVVPESVLKSLGVVVAVEVPDDCVPTVLARPALLLGRHASKSAMRHDGANLDRSAWLVEPIPHGEALCAIKQWHYSHSAPNTGQTFGLLARDTYPMSPVQGAALWLPPTRRAAEAVAGEDWRGVLSLSRLAVDPDLPRNAASFLLAASMRLLERDRWPILLTFADHAQGHTGAIYKATGWELSGVSTTGSYWVRDGVQVGRKRGKRNVSTAELRAAGYEEVRSEKFRYIHRMSA